MPASSAWGLGAPMEETGYFSAFLSIGEQAFRQVAGCRVFGNLLAA